jgi:hypothetical protein
VWEPVISKPEVIMLHRIALHTAEDINALIYQAQQWFDSANKEDRLSVLTTYGGFDPEEAQSFADKKKLSYLGIHDQIDVARAYKNSRHFASTTSMFISVQSLEDLDNSIWKKNGYKGAASVKRDWTNYLTAIKVEVTQSVPKEIITQLEDDNFNSLVQALNELKLIKK